MRQQPRRRKSSSPRPNDQVRMDRKIWKRKRKNNKIDENNSKTNHNIMGRKYRKEKKKQQNENNSKEMEHNKMKRKCEKKKKTNNKMEMTRKK